MAEAVTLAVFGASGRTGQGLVHVAAERALRIRALYRPASRVSSGSDIEVLRGELTSSHNVERTIEGTQGVISVFGAAGG